MWSTFVSFATSKAVSKKDFSKNTGDGVLFKEIIVARSVIQNFSNKGRCNMHVIFIKNFQVAKAPS